MPIVKKRKDRECVDFGRTEIVVVGADAGNTIDFAGILGGFTIIDANVTVTEAFANSDNTISVGLDGDLAKFIPATVVNSIKGVGFTHVQYTANKPTAVLIDVKGGVSATGKAIVSIFYAKQSSSRTDY